MAERASTPSSICLSDLQERDEAVAQEGAQNRVKKGSPLHSSVAQRRSASLTLLARCESLKRQGVGGSSSNLPRQDHWQLFSLTQAKNLEVKVVKLPDTNCTVLVCAPIDTPTGSAATATEFLYLSSSHQDERHKARSQLRRNH